MKFSSAILFMSMGLASATSISSRSAMNKVLSKARRLEDANQEEEEEYAFVQKYSLKLISCAAGEKIVDADNGEYEYNAVTVRLCPTESGCDSSNPKGCNAGYGDYVVGLNTFVNAYLEEQKKQMENDENNGNNNQNQNGDDDFELERYAECREYEVEDDGEGDDAAEEVNYFIGPSCSADGMDIMLALFTDEDCRYASDVAFSDISNGWELPYADGGVVSFNCINCMDYDEDQGAYELREMCQQVYESTALKCEEKMEYFSAYGQDNTNCEYVENLIPSFSKAGGNAGKVFGWLIFVIVIVGLVGYVMWWRKKKAAASSAGDGQMA